MVSPHPLIADRSANIAAEIASLPTTAYRQSADPFTQSSPAQDRPPSPLNPAITIPPSLADLAAQVQLDIPSADLPTSSNAQPFAPPFPLEDRGEMGGKRRKPAHERAGWNEMDRQPKSRKRRVGRGETTLGSAGPSDQVAIGEVNYLTGHLPEVLNASQGDTASSGVGHAEASPHQHDEAQVDPQLDP